MQIWKDSDIASPQARIWLTRECGISSVIKVLMKYATADSFNMRNYTVGVAGLAVNQMSRDSGGSTPSLRTICSDKRLS